ncbi:MAG: hypothetical protein ACRES9_09700 [Gammaproteobacteria bacterium]
MMRIFNDAQDQRWQAAVVFGSYGEVRLVFSRMDADDLRTAAMPAATLREAEQSLSVLNEEELRDYLDKAEAQS